MFNICLVCTVYKAELVGFVGALVKLALQRAALRGCTSKLNYNNYRCLSELLKKYDVFVFLLYVLQY